MELFIFTLKNCQNERIFKRCRSGCVQSIFSLSNTLNKNKMKQLQLSKEHLERIGFVEKIYPPEPVEDGCCPTFENQEQVTYQIKCINGYFYFNMNQDVHVWYHKTIIGSGANFVNLSITHLSELFTVLSAFKVEFNVVIEL